MFALQDEFTQPIYQNMSLTAYYEPGIILRNIGVFLISPVPSLLNHYYQFVNLLALNTGFQLSEMAITMWKVKLMSSSIQNCNLQIQYEANSKPILKAISRSFGFLFNSKLLKYQQFVLR